ncbi:MAG: hypothetical protein ACLGP3_06055 [Acidobacteriota bacterium]
MGRMSMGSMKKMMLGAALAIGAATFTAVPAHAAVRFGIFVGGPAAYMPPCPGPGYAWVNGYWDDGDWTPGYWSFVGGGPAYGMGFYGGGPYWHHDDDGWGGDRGWGGDHGWGGRGFEHGGGWGRDGRGGHFRR